MAGRPLYGYCARADGIHVDPIPAAVVSAVLAMPRVRGRTGLGALQARALLTAHAVALSSSALSRLVARIREHQRWYCIGKARADLPARPHLILTGRANVPL